MSFRPPTHTQTPNEIFALLPVLGEAELKVTLAIIRDTFGWQSPGAATERSLTELMSITGLSKQGVLNGLEAGQSRGTIYKIRGSGMKAAYGLVVNEVDRSTEWTGQPSRPKLVNVVDRTGQPSRPLVVNEVDRLTPVQARAGQGKPDPERQLKERERKRKTTATAGQGELKGFEEPSGGLRSGQDQEQDFTQQGGADRADAPHGADGVDALTISGTEQGAANAETAHATSLEKIPPGGAALAALTGALAGLKRPVAELIEEYPDRAGWLELAPARIRELLAQARQAHGNRYRGALIEALDEEVRQQRAPAKPTAQPNVNDLVRARIYGAKP